MLIKPTKNKFPPASDVDHTSVIVMSPGGLVSVSNRRYKRDVSVFVSYSCLKVAVRGAIAATVTQLTLCTVLKPKVLSISLEHTYKRSQMQNVLLHTYLIK